MFSRPISTAKFAPPFLPGEISQNGISSRSSALERLTQIQTHLFPQITSASSLQAEPLSATSIPDVLNPELNEASRSLINDTLSKMGGFVGWCSKEKAHKMMLLIIATKPNVCAEIGVFGGRSSYPTLRALEHNKRTEGKSGVLHAIDPWSNAEAVRNFNPTEAHANWWRSVPLGKIHEQFNVSLQTSGLTSYCVIHKQTSSEAFQQLPKAIDILHIDGNHSQESSTSDVETYLPKVKEGGYVWFNDIHWATRKAAFAILLEQCDLIYTDAENKFALLRKREVVVLQAPDSEANPTEIEEAVRLTPVEENHEEDTVNDPVSTPIQPSTSTLEEPQLTNVTRDEGLTPTSEFQDLPIEGRRDLTSIVYDNVGVSIKNLLLVLALGQELISSIVNAESVSSALTAVQKQVRSALKDVNLSPVLAPFQTLLSAIDKHPKVSLVVALVIGLSMLIYDRIEEMKAEQGLKSLQEDIKKISEGVKDLKKKAEELQSNLSRKRSDK